MIDASTLPRPLTDDPRCARLLALLAHDQRALWEGGATLVSHVATTAALRQALHEARRDGVLQPGLEAAQRLLANEQNGLEQAGGAAATRVSRLLLAGPGGSKRFYRDVEALLRRHQPRLMVLRLGDDFAPLLLDLMGDASRARSLLVAGKVAAARVLLSLVDEAGTRPEGRSDDRR